MKILPLHEYIHILYHQKAEALPIPDMFEFSHYRDVNTANPLKTMQLMRVSVFFGLTLVVIFEAKIIFNLSLYLNYLPF